MSVDQPDVIDFVAIDRASGEVSLIMVEGRDWGERGELLPELQAKFSTYLAYALDGQLRQDYPNSVGKPLLFELRCVEPPGAREAEFLRIVAKEHLSPEGIKFSWRQIKSQIQ